MARTVIVYTIALFLASASLAVEQPTEASLVQLIATPEKFEGKTVSVVGFLVLTPERSVLYMRDEDYKHSILMNGIWVERNDIVKKNIAQLKLKYVKMVGVFSTKISNAGFLAGGITDVQQCIPWSDPEHPRGERGASPP